MPTRASDSPSPPPPGPAGPTGSAGSAGPPVPAADSGAWAPGLDSAPPPGLGSGLWRRVSGRAPVPDPAAIVPTRASDFVRVRLLIAIPVLTVLLVVMMGGAMYQAADAYFGASTAPNGQKTMEDFARVFLTLLLFFSTLGAVIGAYLAWSVTSPVRQLIQLSARVAGGDFTGQAPGPRRADELGMLGTSFNNMVASLNTFFTSRNRFILESFSGGLVTTDTAGIITAMNSAAEKMLGVNAGESAGRHAREAFAMGTVATIGALVEEALWRREPIVGRTVQIDPGDGAGARAVSVNLSPMRDAAGNQFGLIVNLRDQAELARFYEQLHRADRLATLGTFSAGLAHEVRNPLGAIKGTAQLLAEDVRDQPRATEYCRIIVKEVNRLDSLVRGVQEFAQPAAPRRPTDVSALVRDTVALARNATRAAGKPGNAPVEISEEYAGLPMARVSRDKLTQAVSNIVINAIQATPPGGRVSVGTVLAEGETARPIRIRVANTGSQIPPDRLAKVFEPFFTTKEGGTGLGLSIAYQIVRHHGGEIRAENRPDGVEFEIELPLADGVTPTEF